MAALLIVWLLCGIACAKIASSKGRNVGGFFFLGLCLGVIGLIIAACVQSDAARYVSPRAMTPASGWYTDPYGSGQPRFFDGTHWAPQTAAVPPISAPYHT